MLINHFTLLHTIAYFTVPLFQILIGSPENFENFTWVCILWMFLLQFHIWHIWNKYGNILRLEEFYYLYVPGIIHAICHIALNIIFFIVHGVCSINLLSLSVSTLIADSIMLWVLRR